MALLVVVVLGVPKFAAAGAPAVESPTGPGEQYQSGTYYFTGMYTFRTTAYCTNNNVVTDSHSYGFTGTFVFYGATDGSLFVSIDSGSPALLDSCGSPSTSGLIAAASFTVQIGSPPSPTPTPTQTPTPTPTPRPSNAPSPTPGGSGSHHSSGGGPTYSPSPTPDQSTTTPQQSASPPPPTPPPSNTPSPTQTPTPSASPHTGVMISAGSSPKPPKKSARSSYTEPLIGGAVIGLLGLVVLLRYSRLGGLLLAFWRRRWIRLEPYYFRLHEYFVGYTRVRDRDQPKRRGLSPHKHSGRILAHHHTSYASLVFLLLISSGLAIGVAVTSEADQLDQSQLTLTVLGPPPLQAATIDSPTDGTVTTTATITVQGTCPPNVFVEIWRDGTFAGSTICGSGNVYSILVTLTPGGNGLVARVVDALGQYGPDSAAVLVTYNAPNPPPPTPTPTPTPSVTPTSSPSQNKTSPAGSASLAPSPTPAPPQSQVSSLIITATVHNQDTDPGQAVTWQVTVNGGVAPYSLTWDWADGTSSSGHLAKSGTTSATHTYKTGGDYNVVVHATDAKGNQAALQVVTVVNGPGATAQGSSSGIGPGALEVIWPLLVATALVVFSFWLGERHRRSVEAPVLVAQTP